MRRLLLAGILPVFFLVQPAAAALTVCASSCDHTSIQGATNSAGSGYTALVGNGILNLNRTTYDSVKMDIP